MENQLTSLMKNKYGMTKSSPLVFTEKDTLKQYFSLVENKKLKEGNMMNKNVSVSKNNVIDIRSKIDYYFNSLQENSSKQILDTAFNAMEQESEGTSNYLTENEINNLLDEHFKKIEQIMLGHLESIAILNNSTEKKQTNLLNNMFIKIKSATIQLKTDLFNTLSFKKDRVLFNVKEKTNKLRIAVKNSVNKRILKTNESLKKLVETIDKKVVLEEQEVFNRHVELSEKLLNELLYSQEEIELNEEKVVYGNLLDKIKSLYKKLDLEITDKEEKEIESLSTEEKEQLVHKLTERFLDKTKEIASEETELVEKKEITNDSIGQIKKLSQKIDLEITGKEEKEITNDSIGQIKKLSQKIGFEITDKEEKEIESLSTEEKEQLIKGLKSVLSDKAKEASSEEIEIEV